MIAYLLPMFGTLAAAMMFGGMAIVASRSGMFQPLPAGPFEANPLPDRSSDTLRDQSNVETVFADAGWKKAILSRLCDVEDLLDCLEAAGVAEREVETRGNASFAVRWR